MHPVRESLPAAAEAVAELASGLAAQMEHERRLSPDVVKALTGAGFLRHFVPTAFGGNAGTFRELMRAVSTLGETCAATAWCASLFASSPRFVSFFPPEGRQEIWAGGPMPPSSARSSRSAKRSASRADCGSPGAGRT
ncbi:hypothetical protein Srufu_055750 [Streptomyces libani subsp. rufus]|nr:hypothetical protein Srufu_055750 [Streptomyces libani subsp. rufus]